MKTFGLFDPGNPDHPIRTYEGVMTVLEGTTVFVLGEPEVEDERRVVIAQIRLEPGQTVREVKER
jgi:hypothetical protein